MLLQQTMWVLERGKRMVRVRREHLCQNIVNIPTCLEPPFGAVLLVLIAIVYVNCVIYWKAKWISMFMAVNVYEKLPTAFINGKLLRFDIC